MQAILLISALLLQAGASSAASVYPTTYPFSKDEGKPPSLPDTDPWEKPDKDPMSAKNPAGYVNRFAKCDPYSDKRDTFVRAGLGSLTERVGAPAGFFECRGQAFLVYKTRGTQSKHLTTNCTESTKAYKWDPSSISGKINGVQVCTDCCKGLAGTMNARAGHDKLETALSEAASTGACGALEGAHAEPLLCKYVWLGYNCIEYFKGGKTSNDRASTPICYDVLWRFYSTCKLFADVDTIIGAISLLGMLEPKHYYGTLTVSQMLQVEPIFRAADRVCHPYSYYYPSKTTDPKDKDKTPTSSSTVPEVVTAALLGASYMFM